MGHSFTDGITHRVLVECEWCGMYNIRGRPFCLGCGRPAAEVVARGYKCKFPGRGILQEKEKEVIVSKSVTRARGVLGVGLALLAIVAIVVVLVGCEKQEPLPSPVSPVELPVSVGGDVLMSYGQVNWGRCTVVSGVAHYKLRYDSKLVDAATGAILAQKSIVSEVESVDVREGDPTPEPGFELGASWVWDVDLEALGTTPDRVEEYTRGVFLCTFVLEPCLVRSPDDPGVFVEMPEVVAGCESVDGRPPDTEGYCFTGYPYRTPDEHRVYLPAVFVEREEP